MHTLSKRKIFTLLLIAQAIEISLWGSGRLLQFGPLTLRMYLFIVIIFTSLFLIPKINKEVYFLISLTLFSFSTSLILGFLNGNNLGPILKDISPLLLIFELPFIFYTINGTPIIFKDLSSVFKISSLLLSFLFMAIILFILVGFISFQSFYTWAFLTGEFFFRPIENNSFGLGFFYKGFIYIALGSFFYFFSTKKFKNYFFVAFLTCAILLTLTRGLILSLILTIITYYILERKRKAFFIIFIVFIIIYFSFDYYYSFLGNKETSDNIRLQDIAFIFNNTSLISFFTGHGFGSLINNRASVENSFLEIFYLQGIQGIVPYALILIKSYSNYFKIEKHLRSFFSPFFYGLIFISILSLTNPFINNPIGMFFVLIAYSFLYNHKNISKQFNGISVHSNI